MASEIPDRDPLAQRVTRLEVRADQHDRWNYRMLEAFPAILFTGIMVLMLVNYGSLSDRLSQVEERTTQIDQRLARVEARLDQTNARIDQMSERLNAQMAELNTRLSAQMAELNTRLSGQMAEIMRALGRIEERTRQP